MSSQIPATSGPSHTTSTSTPANAPPTPAPIPIPAAAAAANQRAASSASEASSGATEVQSTESEPTATATATPAPAVPAPAAAPPVPSALHAAAARAFALAAAAVGGVVPARSIPIRAPGDLSDDDSDSSSEDWKGEEGSEDGDGDGNAGVVQSAFRVWGVDALPTLQKLYAKGTLKPVRSAEERFAADAGLLDRVSLFHGDITLVKVDAIVNAANKSLLGGSGVDGSIHGAAGPKLLEECRTLNGCETGQSKITRGYQLPASYVIHTVGPMYSRLDVDRRARQLASCYRTSLQLAAESSLRHIAFPSVSTGIYGYPIEDATHIALKETREFIESDAGKKLERVIFVVWSEKDKDVYESLLPQYFPPGPEPAPAPAATVAVADADAGKD